MADKRKKGCPNETCDAHIKKIKWKASDNYCSKCSAKLVFICPKCFREIEDKDEKHILCARCQEEIDEKKAKVVDGVKTSAKNAGKFVAAGVAAVGVEIVRRVSNDAKKEAVKSGVKVVKDAAKAVRKK